MVILRTGPSCLSVPMLLVILGVCAAALRQAVVPTLGTVGRSSRGAAIQGNVCALWEAGIDRPRHRSGGWPSFASVVGSAGWAARRVCRSLDGRQASSCLALPARRPTGRNRAPAVVDKKRILSYLGNCLPAVVTAKLPSRTRSPPPRHAVTAPPHATARHRILPIGKAKTLAFLPPTAILIFLHALCSAQKPMTTRTRTCRGRASELAPDHRT